MNIDYLTIRLRAISSQFIDQNAIFSIVESYNPVTTAGLLKDSIFNKEIEALKSSSLGEITSTGLIRSVNEGYLNIVKTMYVVSKRIEADFAGLIFSRIEMEQVKYALRIYNSGRGSEDRRLRFIRLSPGVSWTHNWRNFKDAKAFYEFLRETGHYLSPALKHCEEEKQNEIEQRMEKYYFEKYLPDNSELTQTVACYFADQRDLLNIQLAFLLRKGEAGIESLRKMFIPGEGKVQFEQFKAIAESAGGKFAEIAKKITGCDLDENSISSTAKLTSALRSHNLKKYRRQIVKEPFDPMEAPLFLEGLYAYVSNLKIAILFGNMKIPLSEAKSLMILT